ncbi:MAG: ribonuclease M5 [Dialister sp.]|nr:ribonuclease M5 [Dialister sp.]
MIRQVIVVEGKSDIARVKQAVDADVIATGGLALRFSAIRDIRRAYETRGIIILTDPDGPGERIRRKLSYLFPKALHSFVPKKDASTDQDVGIEEASIGAIREALSRVRLSYQEAADEFTMADMIKAGLAGVPGAADKRNAMADILGIGYGNAKQFLKRLNRFRITRKEWDDALIQWAGNTND